MRNLIRFIARFHAFFLFILLEFLCFFLIIRSNHFQRAQFLSSSNAVYGSISDFSTQTTDYFALDNMNDSLAAANAELLHQLHNPYKLIEYSNDTIVDTIQRVSYHFLEAQVIKNSTHRLHNFITLNKGENQGVKPDMGVMTKDGIVGIVKHTSANFSTVISVLNEDFSLSAKLKKNDYFGSLKWNTKDYTTATLHDIPTHITINTGDEVVTSRFSNTFPEGIEVGEVLSKKVLPGGGFYEIELKLNTAFRQLNYVYVIDYLKKDEQAALETATENGP